jgi:hypothetical protein
MPPAPQGHTPVPAISFSRNIERGLVMLTPPTMKTLLISLVIAVLALAMPHIPVLSGIPVDRVYIMACGYFLLLAGNIIRGL